MTTLQAAPRRARIARAITTTEAVYATDLSAPAALHQFYLQRLITQRGPTPAQLRAARHKATIQALIARLTPNVNLALPLMGQPLGSGPIINY